MIEKEIESNTGKAMLQNIQKSVSSISTMFTICKCVQDYYLN